MMPTQGALRSEARRRNGGAAWWWAAGILVGTAIAAAFLASGPDAETSPSSLQLVLAWAVVLTGAVAAGLVVGVGHRGRRSLLGVVLLPAPILGVFLVLTAGMSDTTDQLAGAVTILAAVGLIWEVGLAAGFGLARARADETLFPPSTMGRLDPELDAATAGATTPVAIREYVDDADGQAHLTDDRDALQPRGYELTAVERVEPGALGIAADVIDLFAGTSVGDGSPEAKLVATFRRLSSQELADRRAVAAGGALPVTTTRSMTPGEEVRAAAGGAAQLGLYLLVAIAWVVIAVLAVVVVDLLIAALSPGPDGNTIALAVFFGTLVVGPVLTIRWLHRRSRRSSA